MADQTLPNFRAWASSSKGVERKEIARTLARRPDAAPCTWRWGAWLVHDLVRGASSNAAPHPTDASSAGFVEDALIDALISITSSAFLQSDGPSNLEDWEPWCRLTLGACAALAGKGEMPRPTLFLDDWKLVPEEWAGEAGKRLQLRSAPFETVPVRADGYGARLLAVSLMETGPADILWQQFWSSTVVLRELVEFGDPDEAGEGGWHGRMEAARLLMLQFSIGLMMVDHLIRPPRGLDYDRRSAVERLLSLLRDAVHEMAAIDALNNKFWSEAVRHLAIRRGGWLSEHNSHATQESIALPAEARPAFADFVRDLAGDTENLLFLAYISLQNGVDKEAIAQAFARAEVDLGRELDIANHLRSLSSKAMALTDVQLATVGDIWNARHVD